MANTVTLTFELDDARDRQAVLAAAASMTLRVSHVTDTLFHVEVDGHDSIGRVMQFGRATEVQLMKIRGER